MTSLHKNKWIALSQNYPTKSPAEQEKMQSRMVEWAALSPRDRERARLNFAETKKIAPTERAADWQAYQALSAQEKQALAAKAPPLPTGAAVVAKPAPSSRLTPVPVTRHTPASEAAAINRPVIDPKTLLPKPPAPKPSAPVEPAAPASDAVAPQTPAAAPASAASTPS